MWILASAFAQTYSISDTVTSAPGHSDGRYAALLKPQLKRKKVQLRWRGPEGTEAAMGADKPLVELGRPGLVAVWFALNGILTVGAEHDLVLRGAEGMQPVTLWFDGKRDLVVGVGPQIGLPPEGPAIDEIVRTFGLVDATPGDESWEPRVRGVIHDSLGLLSDAERAAMADVTLVRAAGKGPKTRGKWINPARFLTEQGRGTMSFYDDFLRPAARFVGPLRAPRHTAYMTVMHEIGHAIDSAVMRRIAAEQGARVDTFNAAIAAQDAHGEELGAAVYQDAEAIRAHNAAVQALEADRASLDALEREYALLTPPSHGFRERFGDITEYGATEDAEAFCEAFALFHLDREALMRLSPEAVAWFDAGGHVTP